jgi:O-acetyl-ADP-ribose deacetylase (regulator of RNase III)
MIQHTQGNVLTADCEALVNTVNTVGVMGKGIALQFKQAFPDNFRQYERACRAGEVRAGRMFVVPTGLLGNPRYIVNFPTKRHWRQPSRLEYIVEGLTDLVAQVRALEVRSIAVPPLGCGSGGLEWAVVRPLIERAFGALPEVRVLLFAPAAAPHAATMPVRTARPAMTRGRAILVRLLELYRAMDYRLSRLEVQKLTYFMQEAGEPLRLNFAKAPFGPYADNLNHALQRMEGHYLRGYGDRSRDAQLHLLPGATEEACGFLAGMSAVERRLGRVRDLIDGFETPYGMELLASVHWIATRENEEARRDPMIAAAGVHGWSLRKRERFRQPHIITAWRRLHDQRWLDAAPSPEPDQ